jgi:hypothetical protein
MGKMRGIVIAALVVASSGCDAAPAGADGGPPGDAPRDLAGLYAECAAASSCGAGQECLPIAGPSREAGQCTVLCAHDAECPDGVCIRSMSSSDPRYRCVRACDTDVECGAGLRCYGVFVVTIDGNTTSELCFPG